VAASSTERVHGELTENVVKIKRCAAVVKGGRRFSFAAMVVVGDTRGKAGWGYGKANEVPPSVEKARKEAMRSMVEVPLDSTHFALDIFLHGCGYFNVMSIDIDLHEGLLLKI